MIALTGLPAACSSSDETTSTTAPPVPAEDPAAARSTVAEVVARLRTEPVETLTSGVAGEQAIEIEAAADPTAGGMRLDETLNETIRTLFVLDGDVLYANIYPLAEEQPPFTVTDPGDQAQDFLDKAFTASGRIFGDVDVLAAVVERAPGTVFELGTRDGDDGEQTGFRFVFDSLDIGRLLEDEGLERSVLLPEPGEDETIIEVWLDRRLRELRTSGAMYQDGELIDGVEVVIEYDPTDDPGIEVPSDTLP